ncbi:MAG: homoserine O-succinyltransferase [Spirochaetaceae bacterium]|jgi:homoserine O-succinyltransferase|nr:homoserine O-succinyltransferase [Spirochaetaceae bacterium]
MPIRIPRKLPAYEALTRENIFVMTEDRAKHQDIRPLDVAIVNLMPTTTDTELQFLRLLGNTPLQINISLLAMGSHEFSHAPPGHLERFYVTAKEAMERRFDGMIITGAPVETLPFEQVDYWHELCDVFAYSRENVFSTLHICWGAQAALYYHYAVPKIDLPQKLFGVFSHNVNEKTSPLFRGFDDIFLAPQSRHTECERAALEENACLTIQSETPCGSPFIITGAQGREIYVTGHLEYDRYTLDKEYKRDTGKGLSIAPPLNYYPGNDPSQKPRMKWRAHAHLFFSNWLNFVYQTVPFKLRNLPRLNATETR